MLFVREKTSKQRMIDLAILVSKQQEVFFLNSRKTKAIKTKIHINPNSKVISKKSLLAV